MSARHVVPTSEEAAQTAARGSRERRHGSIRPTLSLAPQKSAIMQAKTPKQGPERAYSEPIEVDEVNASLNQ